MIAILGILISVALPNVSAFLHTGRVDAANSELANVRIANQAYANDHDIFATASDDLGDYLDRPLNGSYNFDPTSGAITSTPTSGYDNVTWSASLSRFD